MPPRLRMVLPVAGLLAAAAIAVLLLIPPTLTDVGPLDLPGVPDEPEDREEVMVAVGDIASCNRDADERVAELVRELPGTVALLGDVVYPEATEEHLRDCFEPAWGELRDRLRPAAGNHDYVGEDASAYFDWFADAAGPDGEGWYAYDLGSWRVIVLNSNCELAGGCEEDSAQYRWLQEELAAAQTAADECLLAYWHHPRYSSGRHGNNGEVELLWEALVEAGVEVTLHGHDHSYERLDVDGVQSFVVGTGGRSLYQFERDARPFTAARHDGSYGVLYLTLGDGTFDWEFLPLGTTSFTDAGSGDCG